MTSLQQQERRALNDGIEDSFLLSAEYAGQIKSFYQLRIGTIKDLYEKFYLNFAVLVELTDCLEGMANESAAISAATDWLNLPKLPTKPDEIEARCSTGIEVFRKYKRALSNAGLLSLPSRGR